MKMSTIVGAATAAVALSVGLATSATADSAGTQSWTGIKFCIDAEFQGRCSDGLDLQYVNDLGAFYDRGYGWQDSISSIKNDSDYLTFVFYSDNNYRGSTMTFPPHTQWSNLATTGWANDVLSSYGSR